MHGLSAFAERLNILNCVNLMRNYIHYMYGFSGFTEKMNFVDTLNAQNRVNPTGNCVHYVYELSGFAKKLNI